MERTPPRRGARRHHGLVRGLFRESVGTGGNDYSHPATRIEFVIGGHDTSVAPAHTADYRLTLEADPVNDVTRTLVPSMPRDIQQSKDGLASLEAALLGTG